MSNLAFITPSAEQQQAVTSLIAALESGHAELAVDGSLLFDVLGGKAAELRFDGATSGQSGALDATIWTDDDNGDSVEVARVRITVEVLS